MEREFKTLSNANGELLINDIHGNAPVDINVTDGIAEIKIDIDENDLSVTNGKLGVVRDTYEFPINRNDKDISLVTSAPIAIVEEEGLSLAFDDTLELNDNLQLSVVKKQLASNAPIVVDEDNKINLEIDATLSIENGALHVVEAAADPVRAPIVREADKTIALDIGKGLEVDSDGKLITNVSDAIKTLGALTDGGLASIGVDEAVSLGFSSLGDLTDSIPDEQVTVIRLKTGDDFTQKTGSLMMKNKEYEAGENITIANGVISATVPEGNTYTGSNGIEVLGTSINNIMEISAGVGVIVAGPPGGPYIISAESLKTKRTDDEDDTKMDDDTEQTLEATNSNPEVVEAIGAIASLVPLALTPLAGLGAIGAAPVGAIGRLYGLLGGLAAVAGSGALFGTLWGYQKERRTQKNPDGSVVQDESGNSVYDLTPSGDWQFDPADGINIAIVEDKTTRKSRLLFDSIKLPTNAEQAMNFGMCWDFEDNISRPWTIDTSSTTGALQVAGGVAIGKGLNVGGNTVDGSITLQSAANDSGTNSIVFSHVVPNATLYRKTAIMTQATGTQWGRSNLNLCVNTAADTTNATLADSKLTINGTSGVITINGTTDSTSSTTGALQIADGVGIAKTLYVNGSFSCLQMGVNAATNHMAKMYFNYVGSGSASNSVGLGLWGSPSIQVDGV
ncbi:hypothetical protein HDU88_009030, partial [Geranomyces variabilis]